MEIGTPTDLFIAVKSLVEDGVLLQWKASYIAKSFDSTDKDDLIQIISILHKFKEILETRLLD